MEHPFSSPQLDSPITNLVFVTVHAIVDDAQLMGLNYMPRPHSGQGMLKTIIN